MPRRNIAAGAAEPAAGPRLGLSSRRGSGAAAARRGTARQTKLRKEKIENGFRKEIEGAKARIGQRAREIEARRVAKSKPPLPKPAMALLRKLSEPKNHQP